jgi:hypothetical protein
MLSSGSDQLCSPLVVLVWRWLFAVFVYWDFHSGGFLSLPCPFLWGRFSVLSAPLPPPPHPHCQCVMMVHCFFSILWSSLTLGAHWLRRWALWSTTCPASGSDLLPSLAFLPFQCSFTDSLHWDYLFALPPFSGAVLCCYARLQFAVCCSVFLGGGSVCSRVVLVYPGGGWGNSTWCMELTCLVCWMSQEGLEPAVAAAAVVAALKFFQCMCCEEAFHGLEVQGVKVWFWLMIYFCLMEEEKGRKKSNSDFIFKFIFILFIFFFSPEPCLFCFRFLAYTLDK